jgi:hypothetical protein
MRIKFLAFAVAAAVFVAGLGVLLTPQRADTAGSLTFEPGFNEFVWDRAPAGIDTALAPIRAQIIAVFHWQLEAGAIYWILVSARVTLPDDGTMLPADSPGSSITFRSGFTEFVWDRTTADIDTALAPIQGRFSTIFAWNDASQSWDSYSALAPEFINTLRTLQTGGIYWLVQFIGVITLPTDTTTPEPPPDEGDGMDDGGAVLGSGGHVIPPELIFPGAGLWTSENTSEGVRFQALFNAPSSTTTEILDFYRAAFTTLGADSLIERNQTTAFGILRTAGPGGRSVVEVLGTMFTTKAVDIEFIQFN